MITVPAVLSEQSAVSGHCTQGSFLSMPGDFKQTTSPQPSLFSAPPAHAAGVGDASHATSST